MNLSGTDRWMCLYYRDDASRALHAGEPGLNDDYYVMLTFPAREMSGTTPEEIAMELITLALEPDWHWQLRRPIEPGDAFTLNQAIYLFIRKDDKHSVLDFPDAQLVTLNWPHLDMVRLKGDTCCKVSTSNKLCSSPQSISQTTSG